MSSKRINIGLWLIIAMIFSQLANAAPPTTTGGTSLGGTTEKPTIVTTLTEEDKARAKLFELTEAEWAKYKIIMQGPRGLWTPNLDPVNVLGVHAKTKQEMQHYAELAAKIDHDRAMKELEFSFIYADAYVKLYEGNNPTVLSLLGKKSGLAQAKTPVAFGRGDLKSGDVILFFTQPDCSSCDERLKDLLTVIGPNLGIRLDIFVVDSNKNDKLVREIALKNAIRPELIQQRVVMLNHDNGILKKLSTKKNYVPPTTLVKRGSQLYEYAS